MRHQSILAPILIAGSSLLSACNSTDTIYAQGPWGPAHAQRKYPRYDTPWNGQNKFADTETVIAEPNVTARSVVEEGSRYGRSLPAPHSETSLPADPIPPGQIGLAQVPPIPEAAPQLSSPAPIYSSSKAEHASPPGIIKPPSRPSAYAGTWKATDGKGNSCKVQLSSVSALDLYKASTIGCSDSVLSSVNAWSFRDSNIILFSKGQVVARLSGEEASLAGTLNGSGNHIKMSR